MLIKKQKKRRIYCILRRAKSKKGEGYIDIVVLTIVSMLVLCTMLAVAPVFITKLNLDSYANELAREAEIAGRVGQETTQRLDMLNDIRGLNPDVAWDRNGQIQIGQDVTVTVTTVVDIGFFTFGSIPITLTSTATGTSEVLWK
jgi:hypothetical protein